MLLQGILLFDRIYLLFNTFIALIELQFVSLKLHFQVKLLLLCLFIPLFSLLIAKSICSSCLFLNAVRLSALVHFCIRLMHLLISFKVIIHDHFKYSMFGIFLDQAFLFLFLCLHLIEFEKLTSFLIVSLFELAVLFLTKFIILV